VAREKRNKPAVGFVVANIVGWFSAAILLATLSSQVVTQWRERSDKGVSPSLFAGQLAASTGFIIYSALMRDAVFVVTNSLLAAVAVLGQVIYLRNRR
jgi:MtN3 and saliva related transmembrane protein